MLPFKLTTRPVAVQFSRLPEYTTLYENKSLVLSYGITAILA